MAGKVVLDDVVLIQKDHYNKYGKAVIYDDVLWALTDLNFKGYDLYAVSDLPQTTFEQKLKKAGISKYFTDPSSGNMDRAFGTIRSETEGKSLIYRKQDFLWWIANKAESKSTSMDPIDRMYPSKDQKDETFYVTESVEDAEMTKSLRKMSSKIECIGVAYLNSRIVKGMILNDAHIITDLRTLPYALVSIRSSK